MITLNRADVALLARVFRDAYREGRLSDHEFSRTVETLERAGYVVEHGRMERLERVNV